MIFLLIGVASLLVAACADPETQAPVVTGDVQVEDNNFSPSSIDVEVGETVTWTWTGRSPHDVRGDGFASDIQQGGVFTHTFTEPGVYEYVCSVHSSMAGSVVVVER